MSQLADQVFVAAVDVMGIADNRDTSIGVIERFTRRGFNVIAYDSRGHGRSEGDRCTYGFFEKQDLRRVLGEELGLEPSPALTQLERAIAAGDSEIVSVRPVTRPQGTR